MRYAAHILAALVAVAAFYAMATDRSLIPTGMALLIVAAGIVGAAWPAGRDACACCPGWGCGCTHEDALARALAEQAADDTDGLTIPPVGWWAP